MTPGSNTLVVGGTGSGKTHALRTLVEAGLETFVLFTEPGGEEVLGDVPRDKLHWHYVPPASPSFAAMIDSANKINSFSFEDLSKLKSGIQKSEYRQYEKVLLQLANFQCTRCDKEFGAVDSWDNTRAICLDTLSGLNIMAMDLVVGSKPVKSVGEWGVAMDNEERLINKLCSDTKCFFVMNAHMEREVDEISGAQSIYAAALGRKMGPKIPRFFSDVVHAKREGDKFFWSTVTTSMDLKARNLGLKDGMNPSFVQIVQKWKEKQI